MKKTVIIECGHGGVINGAYQDLAAKRDNPDPKEFTFIPDGPTVYEGVINRQIGAKLVNKLIMNNIPHKVLNVFDQQDMPLLTRVKNVNAIYRHDKSAWLLSLHSNKMKAERQGPGNNGRGCESFISLNASLNSKRYQDVLTENYKKYGHKWRGEYERNLYILKHTNCPAVLMENYFYDNQRDVSILLSQTGQQSIVDALYDSIIAINKL